MKLNLSLHFYKYYRKPLARGVKRHYQRLWGIEKVYRITDQLKFSLC